MQMLSYSPYDNVTRRFPSFPPPRIFLRTIATGEIVDLGISDAAEDEEAENLVFAADSTTLFYVRKNYPAIFVTAGFYDNQVSYAEPAKWVARLRASKTDPHDLIVKTDMTAGHRGRSGQLGSIPGDAEIMAWLITHARDGRLP